MKESPIFIRRFFYLKLYPLIVIFSNQLDESTNRVIDWLDFFNEKFVRLNGEGFFEDKNPININISNNDFNILTELNTNEKLDFSKVNSIWFRRDSYDHLLKEYKEKFKYLDNSKLYKDLMSGLFNEFAAGKEAINSFSMNSPKVLGNYKNKSPNKIEVLSLARKNNISIPKSIITNRKTELLDFYHSCNEKIITKAIKDVVIFSIPNKENSHYMQYTEAINDNIINKIPETFFPSLFQEKIDKEYEIRVFFIDDKCYSMAIFSQLDSKTEVDFRRYNFERGNRNIPFKLPNSLQEKIISLMNDLDLNTGSLDFIRAKDGSYVFLEVNPVGQYGMTSAPCNYNLDKIIAQYLI